MHSHVVQRRATEAEQASLKKILANAATTGHRWKRGIENALVLWAVSLLGLVVIWLAFAWLGRKLFEVEFGLHSFAMIWLLGVATPLCAVYAAVSSVRWIKAWPDYRPQLRADIEEARVSEEHYVFTEAVRFQDPEHGGLIYFFHTTEDKVLTLFDHESQDLGTQEGDPLRSSFMPQSRLVMVRAPRTALVISKAFSGETLEVSDPIELAVAPEDWPESESYCNIPWTKLKARLGSPKTA